MPEAGHPLIAINGLLEPGERPSLRLGNRYAEAVLRAGGLPVALPPVGGPADLARLLEAVDGLLLGGGDDFTTEPLGLGPTHLQASPVPPEKQAWDLALARLALDRGVPVLGICYGMQLLALAEGARFLQHLPEDRPGARDHTGGGLHPVLLQAGSKLARILGVERLDVISRHHQAVCGVVEPWRVVAVDDGRDGGIVEAVEREGHPFALGVQWHPELSPEGSHDDRLFRSLVSSAGLRAARRAEHTPSPGPA